MQIVNPKGGQLVWKLHYQGNVTVNPSRGTSSTVLGLFQGPSWNDAFVLRNANPYQFHLIQMWTKAVIVSGGWILQAIYSVN
jgi:hypothetical protein